MRHTALIPSAAVGLAALLVVLGGSSASAHESLVSSTPAEHEQLAAAPTAVELVFTDEVLPIGAAVVVIDEAGTNWVSGDVVIDRDTVTAPLSAGMPDAGYQMRWRVVSGDGHPISSVIPFTVGEGTPFQTAATDQPEPATSSAAAAAPGASTSPQIWPTIALGAAGALAAVGISAAILTFTRRRTADTSHTQEPS